MRKYEIAAALGRRHGYRDYLEICTPLSGQTFSMVDKAQFPDRMRLMYRCPRTFADGEPIHLGTESASSEVLFYEVMRRGRRFDLVFVDPWHDHPSSLRDIAFALHLVRTAGAVVVHDCSPPDAVCAALEFHTGDWSGMTYAAYLDVVLFGTGFRYVTIDSDYGCGIISADPRLVGLCSPAPDAGFADEWRRLDLPEKYPFFDANRSRLLNLISIEEFRARLMG